MAVSYYSMPRRRRERVGRRVLEKRRGPALTGNVIESLALTKVPGTRGACQRMVGYHDIETPIGRLWLAVSARGLCRIEFDQPEEVFVAGLRRASSQQCARDRDAIEGARLQVGEYLAGRRRAFDLPLDLAGVSPFHCAALAACREIAYGETRTYSDLALALGRPGGARAVGNAMARNPIPLVFPCHRVLRTDGSLGGFRGGLPIKEWLLGMEAGAR